MDFPKRIKQHKAQSDSFAILLYRLRDLGIFRSATENDYGIDFEIEITHEEKVIGRYLKAQVKSAEDIYIREDGTPTVGGIKQSTLLYWTELSFRTHVIAFAVDLTTEKIYFTKSIFWQATCLLDDSETTKTIEFLPAVELPPEKLGVTGKHKEKVESFISTLLIKRTAFESSISDTIFAHKTLLRNIHRIFELYTDTWHYDAWTEVQSLDMFKTFLECARILIQADLPEKIDGLDKESRERLFDFEYYARKTDWSGDDVSNEVAKTPLKVIMPLLLNKIQYYNEIVLKGAYYWMHKDLPYLKQVFTVEVPKERIHEKIIHVNYEEANFRNNKSFHAFLFQMRQKK